MAASGCWWQRWVRESPKEAAAQPHASVADGDKLQRSEGVLRRSSAGKPRPASLLTELRAGSTSVSRAATACSRVQAACRSADARKKPCHQLNRMGMPQTRRCVAQMRISAYKLAV